MAVSYFPITLALSSSPISHFCESLFRNITWSLLIHVVKTKFLYFYGLMSVRLEIILKCIKQHQENRTFDKNFHFEEISRHRVHIYKNNAINRKMMALKEIYFRCWQIQELVHQISANFLLSYFVGYLLQVIYIMFVFVKIAIVEGKIEEQFWNIMIGLFIINVFTVAYFIVSHKMNYKGILIAGLIHDIAHDSIGDEQLLETMKLFSMQVAQQKIIHITIYGLVNYDKTNVNGVSFLLSVEQHQL